jgi:hypothetical protein
MRRLPASCTLLALAVLGAPSTAGAQAGRDLEAAIERAEGFTGCYEIRFDQRTGETPAEYTRSVPPRVWLTMTLLPSDSGRTFATFVMRPAPGYRQSVYEAERWGLMPNADSLVLTWDNFLTGLQVVIGIQDPDLDWRGRTFWWTDVLEVVEPGQPPPAPPRGSVTARKVGC